MKPKLKSKIIFLFLFLFSTCIFAQEATEYTAEDIRDPFRPLIPEEILKTPPQEIPEADIFLPPFEIKGVVWGTPLPQVIINGNVLKIGDVIEGAKIVYISKERVDISYEGRIFSLPSPGRKNLERKEKK